jgi:hypothetical protein
MFVAVVQVAGPWLCCCGPAHAFAAAAAPVNAEAAPVSEPPSGCPVCAKLAAEKGQREAVAPAVPHHPSPTPPVVPERCPCGGATIEAAPPATLETAADSLLAFVAGLGFVPALVPVPAAVASELPTAGVSDLPFLPPGTRTRVHHVLHC